MLILFTILVILASIILGLIVLIQNPKGGGLSGTFGGVGNQLMGVKQTTDVLEKGTWIFAGVVAVLCILSPVFIPKNAGGSLKNDELINKAPAAVPNTQNSVPLPGSPDTVTP
ncbi:MAG TPA: preprotein translocase subunit SecG [Ferruginibacter sp.]|nr:preprotein translocase subunit SecG [Ferruginibacter sp.]HMP21614.1 preprotein translocase subunit SecG [Ferruginibacter sp.]